MPLAASAPAPSRPFQTTSCQPAGSVAWSSSAVTRRPATSKISRVTEAATGNPKRMLVLGLKGLGWFCARVTRCGSSPPAAVPPGAALAEGPHLHAAAVVRRQAGRAGLEREVAAGQVAEARIGRDVAAQPGLIGQATQVVAARVPEDVRADDLDGARPAWRRRSLARAARKGDDAVLEARRGILDEDGAALRVGAVGDEGAAAELRARAIAEVTGAAVSGPAVAATLRHCRRRGNPRSEPNPPQQHKTAPPRPSLQYPPSSTQPAVTAFWRKVQPRKRGLPSVAENGRTHEGTVLREFATHEGRCRAFALQASTAVIAVAGEQRVRDRADWHPNRASARWSSR